MVRLGLQLGILDALSARAHSPKKKTNQKRRVSKKEFESHAVSTKMLHEHRKVVMEGMDEDIKEINEKVSIFDRIIEQNGHRNWDKDKDKDKDKKRMGVTCEVKKEKEKEVIRPVVREEGDDDDMSFIQRYLYQCDDEEELLRKSNIKKSSTSTSTSSSSRHYISKHTQIYNDPHCGTMREDEMRSYSIRFDFWKTEELERMRHYNCSHLRGYGTEPSYVTLQVGASASANASEVK